MFDFKKGKLEWHTGVSVEMCKTTHKVAHREVNSYEHVSSENYFGKANSVAPCYLYHLGGSSAVSFVKRNYYRSDTANSNTVK